MALAITRTMALAIEQKAEELRRLATLSDGVEIDRLRDETATLQALIAEATRSQLQDRRFDTRGTAVLTPVLVESEEFTGYCLISNLSPDGMKATVYGKFSREQSICVHFTSHELIRGRLVWFESNQVGVHFDHRIDVVKVLSNLGRINARSGPSRSARLPVKCLAEISAGNRFGIAEVRDISPRGVKVLTNLDRVGQQVAIQLDELEEKIATVRWSRSGSAGLVFSKPLSFYELATFS